jgi:very-short-patch-repair endonuclease
MKIAEYKRLPTAKPSSLKKKRSRRPANDYANQFAQTLAAYQMQGFQREYCFYPGRRFRFDFAWLQSKVAIEVHGNNQHGRYNRLNADSEKNNLAVFSGWALLVITTEQLKNASVVENFITQTKKLLEERLLNNHVTTQQLTLLGCPVAD